MQNLREQGSKLCKAIIIQENRKQFEQAKTF